MGDSTVTLFDPKFGTLEKVPYNAECESTMAKTLIATLQQNPNPQHIPPYRIYEILA